jgi:hypothetical protein
VRAPDLCRESSAMPSFLSQSSICCMAATQRSRQGMTEFSTTATESLYQYIRDSTPPMRRFFAVVACDRETRRGRVIMQLNRLPLLAQTCPLMRKHLHAYKPISVGLFVTIAVMEGISFDPGRTAKAEIASTSAFAVSLNLLRGARCLHISIPIHSENASTSAYEFGPGRDLLGLSFGHTPSSSYDGASKVTNRVAGYFLPGSSAGSTYVTILGPSEWISTIVSLVVHE